MVEAVLEATYLILSLSQNGLRSAAILLRISMAACVIDAGTNLDCIHPDKLLCIIQPLHLKLLLADRADASCQCWVVRNRKPLKLWCFSSGLGLLADCWCRARAGKMLLVDLTRFDPVLFMVSCC